MCNNYCMSFASNTATTIVTSDPLYKAAVNTTDISAVFTALTKRFWLELHNYSK